MDYFEAALIDLTLNNHVCDILWSAPDCTYQNPALPEILLRPSSLSCFQPQTGTKFFITAEPSTADLDAVLQRIYELFTDVVLKNPFYELEMPVRCALFDTELERLISATTELQSQRRRGREGGQQYA